MYLDNYENLSGWKTVCMKCDECSAFYKAKLRTARRQIINQGIHQCKRCSSKRAGKKTAKKMSKIYSIMYSGSGNPAKKPGVGEKISMTKKGVKFSEAHKCSLRKPKSNTENIKKAANLPQERERRSKLMSKRMIESGGIINGTCEYVLVEKCKEKILCRSKLEKKFILKANKCLVVKKISSAEKLCIEYYHNNMKHRYLPDFRLDLKTGKVFIVEIKGSYYVDSEILNLKMAALKRYCKKHGYKSILLTEKEMLVWLEKLK